MFNQNLINLSPDLINLILVLAFSLAIGLELRQNTINVKSGTLFGTDRTHLFIGLLGYILYVLSDKTMTLYLFGGLSLLVLLAIYYHHKIADRKKFGFTAIIVALITYTLAPLIYTKPLWLSIAIVTIVLIVVEQKSFFKQLTKKFGENEFLTLAKFLLISGVVLPLLSNEPINEQIPVSPFKIWASVVAISGISYISYLIKKFIFPDKGAFITGILGGLYSSTATAIVLAKKSKYANDLYQIAAAIVLATGMMYIRIWGLALIFNKQAGLSLTLPLLSLAVVSAFAALFIEKKSDVNLQVKQDFKETEVKNPLEFKTALFFAFLFLFFTLLTHYVLQSFGHQGLQILSFIVGVTDIDPFLLSLFTGKYQILIPTLMKAVLIATLSNNLMKFFYVLSLGYIKIRKPVFWGFGLIILANLIFVLW